jgi:hypothetical protein
MGKCMGRYVFGGKDGSWMWLGAYVGGWMGGWHTLRIYRGTAGNITAHSGVCVWAGGWVGVGVSTLGVLGYMHAHYGCPAG